MTTHGEPRVWLDQFPLNEPQPFAQDWSGIRYPGEVIRANSWTDAWGEPLTGDVYFRIILLTHPQEENSPQISDSRIAVCLPGSVVYRQRDRILDEIATIRETQALYLTQRDPEADLIRRTLQQSRQNLEDQLMTQEGTRYSTGAVLTGPSAGDIPDGLFASSDPVAWFSRIASWLLASACPQLPIDSDKLDRPITEDDAELLYRAIFSTSHPLSEGPDNILADLGVGLGLSPAHSPGEFGPTECPVLELIKTKLSQLPVPAPWPDLHRYLAHDVGLTGPLATLYLLVYLNQSTTELEVRLSNDHQLNLLGDRTLHGNRLTGDLLKHLAWDARTAIWAETFGPLTDPSWNDALNHLLFISPDLAPVGPEMTHISQEQRLLNGVGALGQRVEKGRDLLASFQQAAGDLEQTSQGFGDVLERLANISGADYLSVYQTVRSNYADLLLLESDLADSRRLAQLANFLPEIQSAWGYLDRATVPPELPELSVEQQALTSAIAPASLLSFSRPWSALAHQIDGFKARYASAYRTHHEEVNQTLAAYQRDLDAVRSKLRALELLNELPELGQPFGLGMVETLGQLEPAMPRCPVQSSEIELTQDPWCASCCLTLEQSLDTAGLASLSSEVDAALAEKNRMLSNLLVDKILHGQVDQRLEDFLKIVQASDLSALSNTISEELVDFIRRLVS